MAVEGWASDTLGGFLDFEYGKALPEKDRNDGIYSVYGSNGVVGTHEQFLVQGPGIIVGRKGTAGSVTWSSDNFWPIDTTYFVKLKTNECLKYFYYLLNTLDLKEMASTTGVPGLNRNDAYQTKVDLPPFSEQRKIAEILESVDDAIAKTESVIAQTQRVKQGLLQQLLTRGFGHTKFKQTPLGEIPESWDILPIGDIVTFYNGKAHEQDISEEGSHVVVNSKFISTEGEVRKFTNSPSLIAHSNDVLIVMSDIPNGKAIAKCFYVDQDNLYTVNQRIGLLRSKKDDPKFLFYALNRNSYFLSFDDGAKQTNLRKDEVLACPIALPKDVTEQRKISGCLSEIDTLIKSANLDLSALNSLKTGLMSDLLTGRVRVNVDTKSPNKIEEAA